MSYKYGTSHNKPILVRFAHSFTGCKHRHEVGLRGSSSGMSGIARRYLQYAGLNGHPARICYGVSLMVYITLYLY